MKTNKSYTKRLKVTRTGKLVARKPGHDHFNAKKSRKVQLNKKRTTHFIMKKKAQSRFIPS